MCQHRLVAFGDEVKQYFFEVNRFGCIGDLGQ